MSKKVFILAGHPDTESMCCDLADAYAKGAIASGNEVRRTDLGAMDFDPILHKGYKVIQELEPDLKKFQEDVRWCDHFVIVYPSWWSTMPALLKGLFDRAWLPGFAFKFLSSGIGWKKLLKGKTARVFITSDSHPLIARFLQGDNTNEIQDGILWFAGFYTKVQKIGPIKNISTEKRTLWVKKFEAFGRKVY
ncbi:MAG: NADPH-dependent FMN reductase [Parcubacteria bacterium C7867-003]|nr:MAG: NADPH-dependent FMN reductase [Parcubacteria bacterium C7867-003]